MSGSYFFDSRLAKTEPSTYVTDKELSCKTYMNYMNIRLQKMFHYENLPDSMPKEMLEYYLLNNGTCYVTKVDGKLYALIGSFGGAPDAYYRPTQYVVANPALDIGKSFDLEKDGVLVRNDTLWMGLHPLMSRYATLLGENVLTIRTADIMLRVMAMFTAPDDKTKLAAEEYLKNLENGKLGVIAENRFFDEGVKMQSPPSNNGSYLTQFIELHQYLTGTFYNEIGLNANFNMKRESIGEGESSLNEDSLLPLCEDMLKCRKEDIDKINKMYETNITVEFSSAWANNQKEIALGLKKLENEASQLAVVGGGSGDGTGDAGNTENDTSDNTSESEVESDGSINTDEVDTDTHVEDNGDESGNSEDGSTSDVDESTGDSSGTGSADDVIKEEDDDGNSKN